MDTIEKPSVFVGSSTEGIEFARAIRRQLQGTAEITLWSDEFFKTGSTFIETLVGAVSQFDFAILVLTPDDIVQSRNDSSLGPRDNVIFELGLFMGRLGRERTFALHQRDAHIKLPTDLSAVTLHTYEWPRKDKGYAQAVGGAADVMRDQIKRLGLSREKATAQIERFAAEQERQAQDINVMKLILNLVLPEYERWHLGGLAANEKTYLVKVTQDLAKSFESELRHLLSLGLVERQEKKILREFFMQEAQEQNLAEYLKITSKGRDYIEIYQRFARTVPGHK
jgi:hypothetical protein